MLLLLLLLRRNSSLQGGDFSTDRLQELLSKFLFLDALILQEEIVPVVEIFIFMIVHLLSGVPVENVVVGVSLPAEEVPDELPQVHVVRLLLEAERPAVVQVLIKLSWEKKEGFSTFFTKLNSQAHMAG